MVKHIVMWRLKEEFEGKGKAELSKEAKAVLESLVGKIPGLLSLEVGENLYASGEAAMDLVLTSTHENPEALEGYRTHPEHVKVAEFIGSIVTARAAVDYEM